MNKQELIELLPAYAFGILDDDEQQVVETALTTDPSLHLTLAGYADLAAGLAAIAPTIEPPTGHRERMMARLQRDEARTSPAPMLMQQQTAPTPQMLANAQFERGTRPATTRPEQELPVARPLRSILSFAMTAAAALLIVGLLGWNVLLQTELGNARTTADNLNGQLQRVAADRDKQASLASSLQTQLDQSKREVANLQGQLIQANADRTDLQARLDEANQTVSRLDAASTLLSQRGTVVREAAGQVDARVNTQFIANAEAGRGVLLTYNLAPAPEGKTYEFWTINKAGTPIPAGTFQVDEQGRAIHDVALTGPLTDFAAVGVTLEPEGGSPAPTGDILALGNL